MICYGIVQEYIVFQLGGPAGQQGQTMGSLETKQTKCPRPLCIFEPALVNNKWLAGSQSSNVAAKSKWQDQICPRAPKSAAKALHRVHIFAPKQLAGAPDQNILVENNWEQLSILVEELTALNAGE